MVEIPALAISSTDCRDRKRRGEPVWYLVPDGVVQYIAKHDLYATTTVKDARMTATDHAVELVQIAARAASDKQAGQIVAFDVSEATRHHRRLPARLGPQRTPGASPSSTRSRTSSARPAPSRSGARATARVAGCCSTTARSWCTSSTRRSALLRPRAPLARLPVDPGAPARDRRPLTRDTRPDGSSCSATARRLERGAARPGPYSTSSSTPPAGRRPGPRPPRSRRLRPAALWTSDLLRASATADEIAEETGLPVARTRAFVSTTWGTGPA